jgi:hypothetical protein
MLLLAGVAVPFCEELLFRGILFNWLRDRLGVELGVLVSSVVFGLAHLRSGRVVAVFAGVAGIVLALAFYWSGSLWVPVVIHTTVNLTKVAMLYLIRWVSDQAPQAATQEPGDYPAVAADRGSPARFRAVRGRPASSSSFLMLLRSHMRPRWCCSR